MNEEKAFRLYFVTRLHFLNESYDVFAQNGRISGANSIKERKDVPLIRPFLKEAKTERGIIELTAANMLYSNKDFLYDDPIDGISNFSHWNMIKSSLSHVIDRDLSWISYVVDSGQCDTLKSFFQKKFISAVLSRKIQYETIILMDRVYPVIEWIDGFDSGKYIARMRKANNFVTKGTIAHTHKSQIDDFLKNYNKKEEKYDNSVRTPQEPCFDV